MLALMLAMSVGALEEHEGIVCMSPEYRTFTLVRERGEDIWLCPLAELQKRVDAHQLRMLQGHVNCRCVVYGRRVPLWSGWLGVVEIHPWMKRR